MGRAGPQPKYFAHWSGRIFVSKVRYCGLKLAGFCGPKRTGPKNRQKSRFWLAQNPSKAKKIRADRARGSKNSAQMQAEPK